MSRLRHVAFAALLSAFVTASLVRADAGARVLIVAPSIEDSTALRMRDELSMLGFEVAVKASTTATDLAALARAEGAAAVARVERLPPEILIWIGDGAKEEGELRVSESFAGHVEPELLALRAVELLRGRLLPVPEGSSPQQSTPPPAANTVTPSAAVPSTSPSAASSAEKARVSLLAGPALLASPGGLSVSPGIALAGGFSLTNRFSAEAWSFVPLSPGFVHNPDGGVALRAFVLGVGLGFRLTSPDEPFFASVGAGVGPVLLWFEGEAELPRMASSGTRWAALAYGRAGIGYRVHPRVRIRFDGFVGPVFPEPVFRFVGREVASFGHPAVFFALGAEVTP